MQIMPYSDHLHSQFFRYIDISQYILFFYFCIIPVFHTLYFFFLSEFDCEFDRSLARSFARFFDAAIRDSGRFLTFSAIG